MAEDRDPSKAFEPVPARVLARDEPCEDPESCDVHVVRGSDDAYCSVSPQDGHHWTSRLVDAAPVRWVEICSMCGRINNAALRVQVLGVQAARGEIEYRLDELEKQVADLWRRL